MVKGRNKEKMRAQNSRSAILRSSLERVVLGDWQCPSRDKIETNHQKYIERKYHEYPKI
jgi:hypothetical protein